MVIQEVENSEDEDEKDSGIKHEDGSGDKSKTSLHLFSFIYAKELSCYMISWFKFSIRTEILSLPNFL